MTSRKPCRTGTTASTRASSRRCATGPDLDGRTWRRARGRPVGQGSGSRDGIGAMGGADARGAPTMARPAALAHGATPGDGFGVAPDPRPAGCVERRAASLSPEQRAALRESAQGMSFDRVSGRGGAGGYRSISPHPTPGRAGLSGGARFRAARGGGRGGRDAADSAPARQFKPSAVTRKWSLSGAAHWQIKHHERRRGAKAR